MKPREIERITAGENCLFRALIAIVTGDQTSHWNFRNAICNAIKQGYLQETFLSGYRSGDEYLIWSRMRDDGIWTSEVEIFAAAFLLKSIVYVYHEQKGTWHGHDPSLLPPYTVVTDILYIEQEGGNRFQCGFISVRPFRDKN